MKQEAGWPREPVWTLRRREKSFVPSYICTTIFLAQPVAFSLYRLWYPQLNKLYKAEWNWEVIMKLVCMQIFACWDCGFESHRRHGCLSIVSGVCCQVEVSATSWSLVQRSLPTVMRRCVWSSNLVNEEALAHWGLSRQKQNKKCMHIWNETAMVCFKLFCERAQEREKQVVLLVFEPDTFRKQVWTSSLNLPVGSSERCGVGIHINLCSALWCLL